MKLRACIVSAALAAGVAACGANDDTTRIPTPRENVSGALERGMQNCPSAVPGAHTGSEPIEGGIAVNITATNDVAERQIRDLARYQAAIEPTRGNAHSGRGTGGGRVGYCPIVHPGTEIAVYDIAGGVTVQMKSTDPDQVDRLRTVTQRRIGALSTARAMARTHTDDVVR